MRKSFIFAILFTTSLTQPCFGVDLIKDRFYASSYNTGGAIGYHYTNSIKITVELSALYSSPAREIFANLYYHPEIKNTDVTPYIRAGVGYVHYIESSSGNFFSYKVSSGINLPLSSRTNVFAGYFLIGSHSNGVEFGINHNL